MTDTHNVRRFPRRSLPLLVQYRFNPLDDFHTDYSVNISGGGLFLAMGNPPALGTPVYLQFIMRGGTRIIQCRGRIVRIEEGRIEEGREGNGTERGCGVQFLDLDDDDLQAIIDLVHAHER